MAVLFNLSSSINAQDASSEDIDALRSEMLDRWEKGGLIQPKDIDLLAEQVFSQPLADQSNAELEELASNANKAANLIGFILEEYQAYYRENSRFDFVKREVIPFHDAYVEISNRLIGYRNQAYFNLSKKAAERGDEVLAFLFFRDAYRLSKFVGLEGDDYQGMRYQAEIEMKKLLGIQDIGTYTYWR